MLLLYVSHLVLLSFIRLVPVPQRPSASTTLAMSTIAYPYQTRGFLVALCYSHITFHIDVALFLVAPFWFRCKKSFFRSGASVARQ